MALRRLFIAIEIPAAIRLRISSVMRELQESGADVRWEEPEKLHITLKFLGGTEEAIVANIISSLETICRNTHPFTLRYTSPGCFPHKHQPRIVWIGAEDQDDVLNQLARSIDEAMSSFGFEKEKRDFHAHVTIGRVKSQRKMRDLLRRMESITFESQPTQITHIALIESELKPSGSVYRQIASFSFHAKQRNT